MLLMETRIKTKSHSAGFNRLLIRFIKIAFGKTEVVNGIQEIGLTPAIIPTNGSYPLRK
jgi:hypothetical protein